MSPVGLPNLDRQYQKLAKKKDFLIRLNKITPWEEFRPLLEQVRQKPRKSKMGRIRIERVRRYYYGAELLRVEADVGEAWGRVAIVGRRFDLGRFDDRADVVRNP